MLQCHTCKLIDMHESDLECPLSIDLEWLVHVYMAMEGRSTVHAFPAHAAQAQNAR